MYTSFRICFLTITSSTRKETTVVGKLTSYESKQNRVPPDVKEGREIGCRREHKTAQGIISFAHTKPKTAQGFVPFTQTKPKPEQGFV